MPNTTKSPTGRYPQQGRVHHLDLPALAENLLSRLDGRQRQTESLAREAGVSVLMMAMEAGDALREHAADGVVTVQLLRGRAQLNAESSEITLTPGQAVVFQPGVRHDLSASERSVFLLTVTGGRE